MVNLSFQTRIVLFFSSLFITVQVLTLIAIYWICRDNLVNQLGQNLLYAENGFKQLLIDHGERMAGETRILVADFGFRSAISDGDRETVGSALENLTYRIRGHRGFYIGLDGRVAADTAGKLIGKPFIFPGAVAAAEEQGKSVVFGLLDGKLYELAIVPVLAPVTIGWVGIATAVDSGLAERFKHLSSIPTDISLLAGNNNGVQILFSSLKQPPQDVFERITKTPYSDSSQPSLVDTDKQTAVVLVRPLAAAKAEQAIALVLQIDLAAGMRPYLPLAYAVLGLLFFGLLAALAGGYLLARNIAHPVRELAGASQRILSGDFGSLLPVTRGDELGRLAETVNTASRIASEMMDLKQQDQLRRELVASVSHDLRTPLAALHGYLETLQLKASQYPEEERERFLAVAVKQSEKLGRLAQELFDLAQLECNGVGLQAEPFNLMELAQDVVQKYQMAANNRDVVLQAVLIEDLPLVFADIAMMERVFTNLIDNALRHTPPGGAVTIDMQAEPEGIRISVADTGEGIAAEYLPRLFDRDSPLSRKARTKAGGLGLQIAARILALHGSAIQVESALGRGACFSFILPLGKQ